MNAVERARQLRREQTRAEKAAWFLLRNRLVHGVKFRRQRPIGPYIVDFFCREYAIIVELDGSAHQGRHIRDDKRRLWLESQGYLVLRFSNELVLNDPEAFINAIEKSLA